MRLSLSVLFSTILSAVVFTAVASAFGPGGWDHLGNGGTLRPHALDGDVLALDTYTPGKLLVAGRFTDAGGVADADRIATWDGTSWGAIGSSPLSNGEIKTIATHAGKIYAGGTFSNAGGNPNADFLAVWDGASWAPFCNSVGPAFGGNVYDLQIIGNTLYVGGGFQNGAGIASADYLLACDLTTGASSSTVDNDGDYSGAAYALTADSNGVLYAAGTFINLDGNPASDYVARYSGAAWTNMGGGPGPAFGAVTQITRSLAAKGTDVYIGSDAGNIAQIPQADNVARWNGTSWSAVGSNTAGDNGYFKVPSYINTLEVFGSHLYAGGQFNDGGGDVTADNLVDFDGTSWKPVGTNGAGGAALAANTESLAIFGGMLHAGGNFTTAGGDPDAAFIARYDPDGPDPVPVPVNTFKFGKVKLNKKAGTATIAVKIPGPGVLKASGKGIKPVTKRLTGVVSATGARTVSLTIKPNARTKKKLKKRGTAKVSVKVSFTPTGGTNKAKTKKVRLVKKR